MTPEQQRIAIAEACGWKNIWYSDNLGQSILSGKHPFHKIQQAIPDYVNDLNAMHEAVKSLPKAFVSTYEVLLAEIVKADGVFLRRCFVGEISAISEATAAQRAEAFLRTLNLWTDT